MSQGVGMKRRKIDTETKIAAVMEGLRGESSVVFLATSYWNNCTVGHPPEIGP
jgi:hypothetical protein